MTPDDNLSLFDMPDSPHKETGSRSRLAHHAPKWTKYRPKNPVKCDDCQERLARQRGRGPLAKSARWRRTTADKTTRLLCTEHAQEWREADKLPRLKGQS